MNRLTLFLLAASWLMFSCKKSYTCMCNSTYVFLDTNGSYSTIVKPGTEEAYSEKMTKKQARAACSNEEAAIQSSLYNGITDNGYAPLKSGESVSTACELK